LPEIAAQTGLSPQCQIINGIHDSNASLLRHLLSRRPPGEAFSVVSTGTWVIIAAVGASLTALDGERDMLANVDALGRPVACARFMGGREFAALNDPPAASCTPADIAAIVERGIFALPAFADPAAIHRTPRGRLRGTAGDGENATPWLVQHRIADDSVWRIGRQRRHRHRGQFQFQRAPCAVGGSTSAQQVAAKRDAAGN
jgi:sugar (pentulose or hexulose) kinase